MTRTSLANPVPRVYAMRCPLGDHSGALEGDALLVTWV
jgi:hypothetical protein